MAINLFSRWSGIAQQKRLISITFHFTALYVIELSGPISMKGLPVS